MDMLKECRSSEIKLGYFVLLEDHCQRTLRKTARVTELFPDQDGATRAFKILLPEKKLLALQVQKVSPLQISLRYPAFTWSSSVGTDAMYQRH